MNRVVLSVAAIAMIGLIIPSAYAQSVPDWVQNTAGWWADDQISETEFVNAIEFLVNDGIIQVSASGSTGDSQGVPDWVKNTAGWWADDQISETEFVNAIEFLVNVGIINVEGNVDCPYISHPLFVDFPNEIKDRFCHEQTHTLAFTEKTHWDPADWVSIKRFDEKRGQHQINSHGFRGNEFTEDKPENTFRIFVIGDSTTYGNAVHDSETWPAYLQKIFDNINSKTNVEIINAGLAGSWAKASTKMVQEYLINFEPDMILVYGAHTDNSHITPVEWKNYWKDTCQFGDDNDFQVVVAVQTYLGEGNRPYSEHNLKMLDKYNLPKENYTAHEHLSELSNYCSAVADFRNIYDDFPIPIYFDGAHQHPNANKIAADSFFNLILPLMKIEDPEFGKIVIDDHYLYPKTKSQFFKTNEYKSKNESNFSPIDSLNGINFNGLTFSNFSSEGYDLNYANFYDTTIMKSAFYAELKNSEF